MSTNTTPDDVYIVCMPYGFMACSCSFRVPKDEYVKTLALSIRNDENIKPCLKNETLYLFKCGDLRFGTRKTRTPYQDAMEWLRKNARSRMLDPALRLKQYFPDGPAPEKDEKIDVIAVTGSILGNPVGCAPESEGICDRSFKHFIHALEACAPSNAAKPSMMREQQIDHPLYNGHPNSLCGTPLAIYHEVFAKLQDDLANPKAIPVTADELKTTHQLFIESTEFYGEGGGRIYGTKYLWERLFGATISVTTPDDNIGSVVGVTVDLEPGQPALLCAFDWKLELGSNGDAGYQGACTYRKFVSQKTHAKLRTSTCSPCLIIGVMGAYFCIMGAVFVDVVIVEPFTEWILLGGKPQGRVTTVARILKATANALRGLKDYYESVTLSEETDTQAYLPKPTVIEGSSPPPALRYIDRFAPSMMAWPMYLAKMGDRKVVVKFPKRYGKEAHEILAVRGFAPKLHFCGQIKGGLWMVVMDLIEDVLENDFSEDTLPDGAYEDVQQAIDLLHEEDLVFGDLRRPNIIVVDRNRREGTASGRAFQEQPQMQKQAQASNTSDMEVDEGRKGALLVDFDLCAKEGEARYPDTLNDTGDVDWAPGVERCGLIKKEHDRYSLQRLKAIESATISLAFPVRGNCV